MKNFDKGSTGRLLGCYLLFLALIAGNMAVFSVKIHLVVTCMRVKKRRSENCITYKVKVLELVTVNSNLTCHF